MTGVAERMTRWMAVLSIAAAFVAIDPSPRRDRGMLQPPPANAISARANLSLEAISGESFRDVVSRAEALAQDEIDVRFGNDITISRVSLVVLGSNGGLSAPLLSLELNRADWRRNADITQYARYYPDSRTLLGLPLTSTSPTLGTGDVQVTLRWAGRDDLDLAVMGPGGETVFFANPQISSGGTLDVDANGGCQTTMADPVENIFWPTGGAPTGTYQAVVNLFTRCDAAGSGAIAFTLTVLLDGTPIAFDGTVSDSSPTQSFRFDFGTD